MNTVMRLTPAQSFILKTCFDMVEKVGVSAPGRMMVFLCMHNISATHTMWEM